MEEAAGTGEVVPFDTGGSEVTRAFGTGRDGSGPVGGLFSEGLEGRGSEAMGFCSGAIVEWFFCFRF